MTVINLNKVKDLYYINLVYEINKAKDKLGLFEKKYRCDFLTFEKKVKDSSDEKFDNWDDYMEWKAFHKSYLNLVAQKKDFDEGNIRVT